jgi:hypothetical protein
MKFGVMLVHVQCRCLTEASEPAVRMATGSDVRRDRLSGVMTWEVVLKHLSNASGYEGLPLWSSGQSSWLQIQRSRVRFPGTTVFSDK